MRPEGESGRGTGLGPQEALGSGWEASQPGGLGLAWAVLQSSDRCPAREVAAALLAPGLSRARPLPRTRTSTPEPHAQLLPFTGDARLPGNTNRKLCPEPQDGQGPGSQLGAGPPLRFLRWPRKCSWRGPQSTSHGSKRFPLRSSTDCQRARKTEGNIL